VLVVEDRFHPIIGGRRGLAGVNVRTEVTTHPEAHDVADDPRSLMLDPSVFFRPRERVLVAIEQSVAAMNINDLFTPAAAIIALESDDVA